ncbi:hypothetical protein CPB83DRAFT_872246 [Crepidotus variabilis]|uniref:MYND-type domain-containing protein n=1 Tax=Crepidotus variabilis TaxID=179855 RepID=A0A9P6EUT8_9AGAR|nr:hypothetical protein CPB83DRAFT_872246 [Crepidotus variabilis]
MRPILLFATFTMEKTTLKIHCNLNSCTSSDNSDLRCSNCKVVRYCRQEHQTADWPNHKAICNKIKRSRRKTEEEETASPDGFMSSMNPFEISVGYFWGIHETRPYMRARMDLVTQLLQVNTLVSVASCLEHLRDMLRLCRGDNLGVRDIIPGLYLRLNRDQECYDFLKCLSFLNLKNEDVIKGIEVFKSRFECAHAIAVVLLKLRMLLDPRDVLASSVYNTEKLNYDTVRVVQDSLATRSPIWSARPELLAQEGLAERIKLLETQLDALFKYIDRSNKWFWKALLEYEKYLAVPVSAYSSGSREEMVLLIHHSRSWIETEGAIKWVREKIQ